MVWVILISFVALLSLGVVVGGITERSHIRDLDEREQHFSGMVMTQIRTYPGRVANSQPPSMLVAEVVISSDYLKTFLAGLRNIFGGEVRSFQTLLERARREALLRIQEEAVAMGYNAICNIRLDTADIAGRGSKQKGKIIAAAILASGTAYQAEAKPVF